MDELAGKRLLILGLARQGTALARFAVRAGARVTVSDLRSATQLEAALADLADLEIRYVLGEHPMSLLEEADILAVSGGVPLATPLVEAARARHIRITNDSLEFVRRCPALAIGITGSAGKTTTTAMVGLMAQLAGRRTWVGGNIGRPLILDLDKMSDGDVVVQELSSFQLEIWTQSPAVAAILNLTPNHLDRHRTMQVYARAKANILRFQKPEDVAVLSADDPGARALEALVRGRLRWFSAQRPVPDGAYLQDGQIWLTNGAQAVWIAETSQVKLRGAHNLLNVLAAVAIADSAGLSVLAMRQAIETFTGVEHRLEVVAEHNGVQYINDSIATSPERAMAALDSFTEPIILLAGGRDKEMVWSEWARRVRRRVKAVVLFGDLSERLAATLEEDDLKTLTRRKPFSIRRAGTMAEAIAIATELAVPGDVVLLSPGGTSFDAFTDFAARGEAFRQLVQELSQRQYDRGVAPC